MCSQIDRRYNVLRGGTLLGRASPYGSASPERTQAEAVIGPTSWLAIRNWPWRGQCHDASRGFDGSLGLVLGLGVELWAWCGGGDVGMSLVLIDDPV